MTLKVFSQSFPLSNQCLIGSMIARRTNVTSCQNTARAVTSNKWATSMQEKWTISLEKLYQISQLSTDIKLNYSFFIIHGMRYTTIKCSSSHHKVSVHWMPRPCLPKQWDLGQKLRCLWKAWSMAFHALKVVKWALMTPSGHKLTKCKKCQVLTHKKWQK